MKPVLHYPLFHAAMRDALCTPEKVLPSHLVRPFDNPTCPSCLAELIFAFTNPICFNRDTIEASQFFHSGSEL